MTILNELASALGRTDEVANQELAKRIATNSDEKAVAELVENLKNKDKNIQNDCIKVLYETGELKPSLIADYGEDFVGLLDSKNNRLVWGAMTALDTVTLQDPWVVYSALASINAAAEGGSVIARDHAVGILIKLCSIRQYSKKAFGLLLEQLRNCPTNQLPMYAENAIRIISDKNRAVFIKTLSSRLGDIEKETKRKRVEAVIRKVS